MSTQASLVRTRVPRYIFVSVVNVPLVQLAIFLLQRVAGLSGWVANVVAISVLTGPAYLMTKRWVWPESSADARALVAIFWASSILGLVGSAALALWLGSKIDGIWVANAASLFVYGMLFIARFLVLDRVMGSR